MAVLLIYIDLYKCESGFVVKGTSYHYNVGTEKLLCEIRIPAAVRMVNDVLKYIADHHSLYPWAKITLEEMKSNERLRVFVEENE